MPEKNNHPPIPPDHPRFILAHGEYFFDHHCIRTLSVLQREDCANAVRCAWLDLARLVWETEGVIDDPEGVENECIANAAAWVEWGKY